MKSLLGLLFGILLCLMLASFAGENPIHVLSVLVQSAFGSTYDLGLTLFYSTSLIFTSLSVAVAFHSGLFNIGAEGQLLVASMAATIFALCFPDLPGPWLAPWLAGFTAILAGALWGFIPGYLKALRGSHEVVITMMMNFIAAGITSYFTLDFFKSEVSQNPETQAIGSQYMFQSFDFIAKYFPDSPANLSLVLAMAASLVVHWILEKSRWGYELRMTGLNEQAANYSGINSQRMKIFAMTLAGALAGGVAFNEILGSAGKFRIGFSPEYGFIGIAVSLLARNHPLWILPSAFLFGALQKGAADLDMETTAITKDFARIMQALIIFSVIGFQHLNFSKVTKILRKGARRG